MLSNEMKTKIEELLKSWKIVLFMKWEKDIPMCGFSANVVNILKQYTDDFVTYNILTDFDLREWLKDYSNWPTFPQLYINWELIWGSDIVTEMHEEGELEKMIK